MEQSFGLRIYHEYVAWAMFTGFKWVRYSRRGDRLCIWSLKMPSYTRAVMNKECADQFERWYNWMKNGRRII